METNYDHCLTAAWDLYESSLLFTLDVCNPPPKQQRAEQTHPSHEVHSSPSVQQKCGHVNVAIVSRNVEGGETTLRVGGSRSTHTHKQTNTHIYIIHRHTHARVIQYRCLALQQSTVDVQSHSIRQGHTLALHYIETIC